MVRWSVVYFIVALGFAALAGATALPDKKPADSDNEYDEPGSHTPMVFSFDDVPSSTNLEWTPCFGEFTCANLQVPLDYENIAAGFTTIAFAKHSANVSDPSTAEDVLVNPGGPGGSGVSYIVLLYNTIRNGDGLGWNVNLIGFDPRGVGDSGPNFDCFSQSKLSSDLYFHHHPSLYDQMQESWDENGKHLPKELATAEAFGKWCQEKLKGSDAGYAGTAAVAQDMLYYTRVRAESLGKDINEAKLNFFGGSYGTVLGTTFAALYPDKVRRMILSGVVDVPDWYSGHHRTWHEQTDQCVESFFDLCYTAGLNCAFNKGSSSPMEIRQRFEKILADIEAYPIPLYDPKYVSQPDTLTAEKLRGAIFKILYHPLVSFPDLAEILDGLETRNATRYLAGPPMGKKLEKLEESFCAAGNKDSERTQVRTLEEGLMELKRKRKKNRDSGGVLMVPVIDVGGRYNITTPQMWKEHISKTAKSRYFSENFFQGAPLFRAMSLPTPKSQVFDGSLFSSPINTSTPILFAANVADPITPAAWRMSKYFVDSVVLTSNSTGHCMQDSNCSRKYVGAYIENGTLPEHGVLCETEEVPFLSNVEAHRYNIWWDDMWDGLEEGWRWR